MGPRRFDIGDHCTFRDLQGVTREGRIVATEQVGDRDRFGRHPGRWLTIRLSGTLFEDIEIPSDRIGCILESTA